MTNWGTKEWFKELFVINEGKLSGYFDHSTNGYAQYRYSKISDFITKNIKPAELSTIFDVGSATGEFTKKLADIYHDSSVIGSDFLPELVELANKNHPNVTFILSSLPNIPLPNQSIDLICALEVLYYLSEENRVKAINEFHRILKTKGKVLFSSVIGKKQYFTQESAKKLLGDRFLIIASMQNHFKFYHFILTSPLEFFRKLLSIADGKRIPNNNLRLAVIIRKGAKIPVFGNILILKPLCLIVKIFELIQKSIKLPYFIDLMFSCFNSKSKISNITYLCVKKD